MSNPTDKFVSDRMADTTDIGDVDDGVNALEAAIRTCLGFTTNPTTQVPGFAVDADGNVRIPVSLQIVNSDGPQITSILSESDGIGTGSDDTQLATAAAIYQLTSSAVIPTETGDEYGSIWVGADLSLKIGRPAYWQSLRRVEVETSWNMSDSVKYSIEWDYLIAEHPALTADTDLRPVGNGADNSEIIFPCTGLWLVDFTALVPNYSGGTWNPKSGSSLDQRPEVIAVLEKDDYSYPTNLADVLAMDCRALAVAPPGISTVTANRTLWNLEDKGAADDGAHSHGTGDHDHSWSTQFEITAIPSWSYHTLHLSQILRVTSTTQKHKISVEQRSGGVISVGDANFRLLLLHLPDHGDY